MRITSAGLVGIGQADPEGLLHIEASSSGASYTADAADTLILERNLKKNTREYQCHHEYTNDKL